MEENKVQQSEPVKMGAAVKLGTEQTAATSDFEMRILDADFEARIWDALRECYDPEIPANIVDLGLIYGLKVENEIPGEANVYVRMTLTAPGCGMGPMIANDVKRKVQQVSGVKNVLVELVFDPPWNSNLMTEAAKLQLNMI